MSHIPERKEKDCLNCGTIVQGHYCHNCGQENVVPKETFWHMVTHFFYDITHFDSSFFHTIHHLVLRPGFLSKEYMKGKRASYLHPVRMYVFSSAIFFLLFFSFLNPKKMIEIKPEEPLSKTERAAYVKELQRRLETNPANQSVKSRLALALDTNRVFTQKDTYDEMEDVVQFGNRSYRNFDEYDSIEKTLPVSERDGWLMRRIMKKEIEINNRFRNDPEEAVKKLLEGFFHRLPYLLFLSLPLFALILKLVYIRRKKFYFADHGIFTIHLYVFSFLVLLACFGLDALGTLTHMDIFDTLILFMFLGLFVYLLVAMRKFYEQGWGKTIIKFLLVTILSLLMMMILFLFFLIFSAATI